MGVAEIVSGKLPIAKKTGYGSIEFSNAMVFTCFLTFGMFFFTYSAQLNCYTFAQLNCYTPFNHIPPIRFV